MDYSQLVIPEVIDNGANEASESRCNMGPSKSLLPAFSAGNAGCLLTGALVVPASPHVHRAPQHTPPGGYH